MRAAAAVALSLVTTALLAAPVLADPDLAVAESEDGKHFNAEGDPTFLVEADGTVDWYTFSGFRRYHSECHVCHGPDGMGSSYAPPIREAVMRLTYPEFVAVVAVGQQNASGASDNSVMPGFGENNNVMCYIDDIWTYLRARGSDAIPRGRPGKRADKPASFVEHENDCMG